MTFVKDEIYVLRHVTKSKTQLTLGEYIGTETHHRMLVLATNRYDYYHVGTITVWGEITEVPDVVLPNELTKKERKQLLRLLFKRRYK